MVRANPGLRIPRRSTLHRIAALALYRALLAQARVLRIKTSIKPEQCTQVHTLIRNRFRQTRFQDSRLRLRVAFDAGYEAIDLLDAAVAGDSGSESRILKLLESAPSKSKDELWERPTDVAKKARLVSREARISDVKGSKPSSILNRPLPLEQLKGKRHVPKLVNANSFPFLRIKKPQPEVLNGIIRMRIKQRTRRHELWQKLEKQSTLALQEDIWDKILAEESEGKVLDTIKLSWSESCRQGISYLKDLLRIEREKNRTMSAELQGVVDREAKLHQQERAQRKAAKERERLEKRKEKLRHDIDSLRDVEPTNDDMWRLMGR